ncbi:MAG TPA: hydrogenase formation protein HypD [Spongiibacteraceae bacterium]|nr:hydrogenase formation protein HypD [Spongiibacteraceae bacterium]
MKWLDEFRDRAAVDKLVAAIHAETTQDWRIMEVCGGQTHSIVRYGLDALLPAQITLIHGPGCPVCVTPADIIDRAVVLAMRPNTLLCSFGDMLRVPGSTQSLAQAKAAGGNVRSVYSPLDAVQIAAENKNLDVVFLAVGFETTAPANALAVLQAKALGLNNFSLLVSHVLVPPAIAAIAGNPDSNIDGFLAAGHVCAVMGAGEYEHLAQKLHVPIVITGFEPVDILQGVLHCVRQLERGEAKLENEYARVVRTGGNTQAQDMLQHVFHVAPQHWRGIGELAQSGLAINDEYREFDALRRFDFPTMACIENPSCISGDILRGTKKPAQCPAFGTMCTPEHPLGAPMVSAEGACAAYFRYRNHASTHTSEPA